MPNSPDFDTIRRLLPDLDELRPLLDALLGASQPDADETWSATGELATLGSRLVDEDQVPGLAKRSAEREARRIDALYAAVAGAIAAGTEGDHQTSASRLLEAAAIEEKAGRAKQAAAFARAAFDLAVLHGHHEGASLALRRCARAERSIGHLDAALGQYREAMYIAGRVQDDAGRAEASIGAGNVVEQQGRWVQAERWYRRALDILEALEPPTPAHWHALLNLHIVLRSRGDVDGSVAWLDAATSVAEALDDPSRHPFLGNARGQLAMAQGDPDAAQDRFLQALEGADTARAVATIRLNLAESLLAAGRTLDAAEQGRAAEREALLGNAMDKLPEVYRMLGRTAAQAANADAFVLFERSLQLSGEVRGLLLERAQTLQAYGDAENSLGHPEAALDLWRAARDAYDELGVDGFRRPWADCFDTPFPSFDPKDLTS